jgi:hypothetical protein
VAAEQHRIAALTLRWPFVLALVALTAMTTIGLLANRRQADPDVVDWVPVLMLPGIAVVLAIAFAMWRDDGGTRRGYHLAMPVGRVRHQLLRSFSGWPWAMAVMLVAFLWSWTVAAATGGEAGLYRYIGVKLHNPEAGITPAIVEALEATRGVTMTAPAWQWIVPFVVATLVYLIGSALAIAAVHPARWIVTILLGLYLLISIAEVTEGAGRGASRVHELITAPVEARYGVWTLLTGMTPETVVEAQGERGIVRLTQWQPSVSAWLASLALWGMPAFAALLLALRRRRDV